MTLTATGSTSAYQNFRPFHCGEAMLVAPARQVHFEPSTGYTTWRCACGFQQDTPAVNDQALSARAAGRIDETRLVAALSQVERLQWELDIATFDLRVAVEDAIQQGASPVDIAAAIDLGPDEVQLLVSQ